MEVALAFGARAPPRGAAPRASFSSKRQAGPDRAVQVGVPVHLQPAAEQGLQVPGHRRVARHPAGEHHRLGDAPAASPDSVGDVAGQSQAQPVADRRQREAGRLRVAQVGLGEHGAAGGDHRHRPAVGLGQRGQLRAVGQPQAARLLVQEAAGAGGAGGVGLQAAETARRVERRQAEALRADHQQGAGAAVKMPGRSDRADLPVVDRGAFQEPGRRARVAAGTTSPSAPSSASSRPTVSRTRPWWKA